MAFTSQQKHFIKKNIKRLSLAQIASNLDLPEKQIAKFIKSHYPDERSQELLSLSGARSDKKMTVSVPEWNFGKFLNDNFLIFIGLFLLVIVVYFNSLNNAFVSDDIAAIAKNPNIGQWSDIFSSKIGFLGRALYLLIYHLAGLNPMAFRLVNLLFHLGSTWLVFIIVSLMAKKSVALYSSLIFAVHPILIEGITWISGGPYARYAFFFLLSFLFYLLSDKNKKLYYFSIVSFVFSLLSAVPAVSMILAYAAYEFARGQLMKNWKKIVPFVFMDIFFAFLYVSLIGNRVSDVNAVNYQSTTTISPFVQVPVAVISYLKLILWPGDLTLYHTEMHFTPFEFFLMVIFFIAFVFFTYLAWKKNRKIFFWLTFFIIALLPTLTPYGVSWVVAERYVYLGALGIFIACALCFDWLAEKIGEINKKYAYALYVIFGAIILSLSIRTILRNIDWKNEDNLWIATAKTSPSGQNTHNNLGDVYARNGNFPKAVEEFTKATQINPNYADAYHNLANTYQQMGQLDKAVENYQKALSINPNIWQSWQNLASIYYNTGNLAKADDAIKHAIAINPNDQGIKDNLATIEASMASQGK